MGAAGSSTRNERDESVLRVILVGRTGLDAKLRLDPGVELVRAKTAIDAVGELSNPIDPEAQSQSVVIVAPGCGPRRTGALRRRPRQGVHWGAPRHR
jgi:hypothetical protein